MAYTSKTKLIDLENSDGDPAFTEFTQIKISTKDSKGNETVVYLDVNSDTTIKNFVDKFKSVGVIF